MAKKPFDYAIPRAKYADDGRKIRPCARITSFGSRNRYILRIVVRDGLEYSYHATKGWRVVRLSS